MYHALDVHIIFHMCLPKTDRSDLSIKLWSVILIQVVHAQSQYPYSPIPLRSVTRQPRTQIICRECVWRVVTLFRNRAPIAKWHGSEQRSC